MEYEVTIRRMPAGVHGQTGFEARPLTSGFSRQTLVAGPLRTRSGEYKAFHATNASGTTWLLTTRLRVRVPPSRLGQCVYRDVAQLDRARRFANTCRCVIPLCEAFHMTNAGGNYMTYGVAGSNPVVLTSNGKGVAQLAEHIRCFTKTLSSCDFTTVFSTSGSHRNPYYV